MIEIKDIYFAYQGKEALFEDFSLTIPRGEFWALIGPSGCGKSSLLSLLAGLKKPLKGEILIEGKKLKRPRPESGLVFQDHGLLPWAKIRENIKLGLKIRSFYGADGKHSPKTWKSNSDLHEKNFNQLMQILELKGKEDLYPAQLSRGQRQRAAIARTLIMEPDLLLMDEPFSALDPPIREELQDLMAKLGKKRGITSLIVTHDIAEAVILGEKILIAKKGSNNKARIIENPLALKENPRKDRDFNISCQKVREIMEEEI